MNKYSKHPLTENEKNFINYNQDKHTYYTNQKIKNPPIRANHFVCRNQEENKNIVIGTPANGNYYNVSNFTLMTTKTLSTYIKTKRDCALFEVISPTIKRKMYFDIDFNTEDINDYYLLRDKLLGFLVLEGLDTTYTEYLGTRIKKGKPYVSAHLIMNNGMYFEDHKHQLNYMRYLNSKYSIFEDVDKNVYDKSYQLFRLPYQSKPDSKNKTWNKDAILSFKTEPKKLTDCYITFTKGSKVSYPIKTPEEVMKNVSNGDTKPKRIVNRIREGYKSNNGDFLTCFSSDFKVDIGLNDGTLEYIIKSIPNNSKVSYDVFRKIGMALKRVCFDTNTPLTNGLNLWIEWTKQYDTNVDEEELTVLYDAFNISGKTFGRKSLVDLAKIFNPKFDKMMPSIEVENYYDIDTNDKDIRSYTINERYMGNFDKALPIIEKNKWVVIKSNMGTGKSYMLKSILNSSSTILYISCKRSFGASIYKTMQKYGFVNYMTINVKEDIKYERKLICSVESLKYCNPTGYDYVFFDECETICANTTNDMNKRNDPATNLLMMNTVVKNSNHICFMDAYSSNRTIRYIKNTKDSFNDKNKIHYILNTYKDEKRTYTLCKDVREKDVLIATARVVFVEKIREKLTIKKRCVVCSGSRTFLECIRDTFLEELPDLKILCYTGATPLTNIDVNEEWSKCDLLLYSPTITAGISYEDIPSNIKFDNLFMYIGHLHTPIVRDMIQAHKRVRLFNDNNIIICKTVPKFLQMNRLPITRQGVIMDEQNWFQDYFGNDERATMLENTQDLFLFKTLYIDNILEKNISLMKFTDTIKYFFKTENIEFIGHTQPTIAEADNMIGYSPNSILFFDDIKDIDNDTFEDYKAIVSRRDKLDMNQDSEYNKHLWKVHYKRDDVDLCKVRELWDGIYGAENSAEVIYQTYNLIGLIKSVNRVNFINLTESIESKLDKQQEIKTRMELLNNTGKDVSVYKKGVINNNAYELKKQNNIIQGLCIYLMGNLNLFDTKTNTLTPNNTFDTFDLEKIRIPLSNMNLSSIRNLFHTKLGIKATYTDGLLSINNTKTIINYVFNEYLGQIISEPIKTIKKTINGTRKNITTYNLIKPPIYDVFKLTIGNDDNFIKDDDEDDEDDEDTKISMTEIKKQKRKEFMKQMQLNKMEEPITDPIEIQKQKDLDEEWAKRIHTNRQEEQTLKPCMVN